MIYLKQDEINRVVVTLTENTTIQAPIYFLFEFISDDTKFAKVFTAEDISSNICRYNEFIIELTDGPENLLEGIINLNLNGYYKYNVYQQNSPTNLDISLADGIVENGIVYVSGDIKPNRQSYNNDNNYIAYQ